MLLSKDTITVDGVTMTIQEYLDLQEKKNKEEANKREFKSDSKKFDFVKKGPKRKHKYEVVTNGRVIWTRKYTKEDIERIKKEEKMMGKGLRFEILEYLRERSLEIPKTWIKNSEIRENFSQYKRTSVSASLTTIFKFLNHKEYAIRRRIPKEGYEYNISPLPENVYEEFVKWSHDFEKRPTKKTTKDKDPKKYFTNGHFEKSKDKTEENFSEVVDKDLERSKKEFDEIIRKGTEQTLEKVAEFIKQVNINININGKIRFEFGLMKGE